MFRARNYSGWGKIKLGRYGRGRDEHGCRAGRCRVSSRHNGSWRGINGDMEGSACGVVRRGSEASPPVVRRSSGRLGRATHPGCERSVGRHTATDGSGYAARSRAITTVPPSTGLASLLVRSLASVRRHRSRCESISSQ